MKILKDQSVVIKVETACVVGLITLVRLKINSQDIISERASTKIRRTIVRIGLFSLLMFVFAMVTFVCHVYEFQHHDGWRDSFRKFVV
jgi:smoothened protein